VLARFKVLTVVVLKIQVLWDITPCQLIGPDILKLHLQGQAVPCTGMAS
jgi:hypothetical protein